MSKRQRNQTETNTTMPEADSESARSLSTPPPPMTSRFYGPTMPRPGQPGAMQFDGKNITEFLEEWNTECEDFGLDEPQRRAPLPIYCIPSNKYTVKLSQGW